MSWRVVFLFLFFMQPTAYEMRISDWSSDLCSSVLAARTHVLVLDAAEIDPDLAVLVSELRREAQVFLAFGMPPAAVVGARPRGPRVGLDRVRRRAQGEDVAEHRPAVALPLVTDEAGTRIPAHLDQRRAPLPPRPTNP